MTTTANSFPPWQKILPTTPQLPKAIFEGTTELNNIDLWYGLYGKDLQEALKANERPILFLHGGRISSRWWGNSVSFLANRGYAVIATDTRAHGRSTDDFEVPLSYDLFAADVIALLDHLKVPRVSVIGWSDGAITSLIIAMNSPSRLDRVLAFGANSNSGQINANVEILPYLVDLKEREEKEWEELAPSPRMYTYFSERMTLMQSKYPLWTSEDFAKVPILYQDKDAPVVWIGDGDHEELLIPNVARDISNMVSLHLFHITSHGINIAVDQWLFTCDISWG